MNRENFEKLLKANREAPAELFDMALFCGMPTPCGTPACLLGNYALRTDLQSTFFVCAAVHTSFRCPGCLRATGHDETVWVDGNEVCEHFDITQKQAGRLFAEDGCNNARTDRDAAIAYLEHFMATGETPPPPDEDPDPFEDDDDECDCDCDLCREEAEDEDIANGPRMDP